MVELKELCLNDGMDVFEMIKEIGPGENGFGNSDYDMDISYFGTYLQKHIKMSKGIGLSPNLVPQTIYWLYVDNKPV